MQKVLSSGHAHCAGEIARREFRRHGNPLGSLKVHVEILSWFTISFHPA